MRALSKLVRENIRTLEPYRSARDEHLGDGAVLLDANENAFAAKAPGSLARYPDPGQRELKLRLAELKGVAPEQIFLGNGSDEAIDLLIRCFCTPGVDEVIAIAPSYGMYAVAASINDVALREVPLDSDFDLDSEAILAAVNSRTKLMFLCSPNNPTGNLLDAARIERLLRGFQGLVVLDEAYVDFSPESSWLPRLEEFEKLVIIQTLSKAWGLADLRIGMLLGDPALVEMLSRVKPPYNVSGVGQRAALARLSDLERFRQDVQSIVSERERLATALQGLPSVDEVFSSDANFLLVRFQDAAAAQAQLYAAGVIVRNRSSLVGCAETLRITVGTEEQNRRLVSVLSNVEVET